MSQKQEGGDGSVNTQVSGDFTIIQQGLTISEVRKYATELWQLNFPKMVDAAKVEAENRINYFIDRFLNQVVDDLPKIIEGFEDPDKVNALIEAEKQFTLSGDEKLGDTLITLLKGKCLEDSGSLTSIVLSEALKTVSQLTVEQIDALMILFLITRVKIGPPNSIALYGNWLNINVMPFVGSMPKHDSSYMHMNYSGVATLGLLGADNLAEPILRSYPDIFSKGFALEDVREDLWAYDGLLFEPCLNDNTKKQIKTGFADKIEILAAEAGLTPMAPAIGELQSRFQMTPGEVIRAISEVTPGFEKLARIWESTLLSSLFITPVGVAIAHSRWQQTSDRKIDISIWLSREQ